MKMKTSPNDVSNQEILQELRKLSGKFEGLDVRFDGLEDKFVNFEGRFDGLEGRFVNFEGRFDGLEGRFEGLEGKFDGLENKFGSLEGRFDGIEGKVDDLDGAFLGLAGKFHNLDRGQDEILETIQGLAQHMDTGFANVRGEMQREIGKVRAVMVTKDYLDEKLANQYSDIIQHTRREIERALR